MQDSIFIQSTVKKNVKKSPNTCPAKNTDLLKTQSNFNSL